MSYNQFIEQLKIENECRTKNHYLQEFKKELYGENIYSKFCIWCNAFNNSNGKTDANLFAKFLKQENIELTFWQRKHLAEKYFGYKYEYKHDKGEWEITKIKA